MWVKASFSRWIDGLRDRPRCRTTRRPALRAEWLEDRTTPSAASVALATQLDTSGGDGQKSGRMARAGYDLTYLYHEFAAFTAAGGTPAAFQPVNSTLRVADGFVAVVALPAADPTALQANLTHLNFITTSRAEYSVSGYLPISALPAAAALPSLRAISPAYRPVTSVGAVDSQGVAAVQADQVTRFLRFDGSGVTVGVLSDSYNVLGGANADVRGGDLPGAGNPFGLTTPVNVLSDGTAGDTDEGRAMLQIVHDVAPGARLAFATAGADPGQLAANIRALANAGADVIVDDVTFPTEPMFQDGPAAQAVSQVVAAGVSYFSAAGNLGHNSYEEAFRGGGVNLGTGPGGTGVVTTSATFLAHDFDPTGRTDFYQTVTLPAGKTIFSFQWSDPFFSVGGGAGARSDLDLAVFDMAGQFISTLGGFTRNVGGDPVEVFAIDAGATGGQYQFAIGLAAGVAPARLKYVAFRDGFAAAEYATDSSTVFGHANAAGAVAVGAVAYNRTPAFGGTPAVESYSSRAGTPVLFDAAGNAVTAAVRQNLVVAPDGVNTTFFGTADTEPDGYKNFAGTSAAAPHAAGVAALVLQAKSGASPAEVASALRTTALDIGPAGYDADGGAGLIRAARAVAAAGGPLAVTFDGTAAADDMVVRLNAAGDLELVLNGVVRFAVPAADVSGVAVIGLGGSDTLTVDYANGDPVPAGGLSFAGGPAAGTDRLVVTGYAAAAAAVTHTGLGTGNLRVGSSALVSFTGVDGVSLAGVAADLVVTLPGTPTPDAVLADDGDPADPDGAQTAGASAVRGSAFAYTQFVNPVQSLTVTLGSGGTAVAVRPLDAAFAPAGAQPFRIVGGAVSDTVTVFAPAGRTTATPAAGGGVVVAPSSGPAVTVSDAAAVTVVGTSGGGDVLAVNGTAGADVLAVAGGVVRGGGVPVAAGAGIDAILLYGRDGADTFDITPGAVPVSVDGGDAAGDVLLVRGAAGVADRFSYGGGADATSGTVALGAAVVGFTHIEAVRLDGGAGAAGDTLVVGGTSSADVFSVTATANQSAGRLELNDFAPVAFENFGPAAALALAGGGGGDLFAFAAAPGWGVSAVAVDGGAATDAVVVTGTAGDDVFSYDTGSGNFMVFSGGGLTGYTLAGVEVRRVDGLGQSGGDRLSVPSAPPSPPPPGSGSVGTSPVLAYQNIETFAVRDVPAPADDGAALAENTSIAIDVRANDTPSADGANALAVVIAPRHGTAVVSGGRVVYTPDQFYNDAIAGPDGFTYRLTDADGDTATAAVVVHVTPVNDRPLARTQSLAATAGTPVGVTLTGDDGDPGVSQALRFALASLPARGTLTDFDRATGRVTYTPAAGYTGADSFTFTVTDDATAGGPEQTSTQGTVFFQVASSGTGGTGGGGGGGGTVSSPPSVIVPTTGVREITGGTAKPAPRGITVAGAGAGGGPHVRVFDAATGALKFSFFAYDPAYRGGVRVATGDIDGDGVPDIVTATGPGGAANVKVFRGTDLAELASFYAFDPVFQDGCTVAAGDVDGLPGDEIVVGAAPGAGPQVRTFKVVGGDGVQLAGPLGSFYAYDADFRGGVNVAVGNFDGAGGDEIVTGAASLGGPHVKVFGAGGGTLASFFAFGNSLLGVSVAVGDVDGDGRADIVTGPGDGGGPIVRVFAGGTGVLRGEFAAFDPDFRGGIFVGVTDPDGDGHADILVAPAREARSLQTFDGETFARLGEFDAFDDPFPGGVFVAGE